MGSAKASVARVDAGVSRFEHRAKAEQKASFGAKAPKLVVAAKKVAADANDAPARDPLVVIRACGEHGCPPGALGKSCSKTANPNAFPQAFAAYGYRLAEPLVAAGKVRRFHMNGQTRFVAVDGA